MTELLAEAAYDANDAAWSAELSGRLASAGTSAEYELKGKLGLGWSQFKAGKLAEAAAAFDEVLQTESARRRSRPRRPWSAGEFSNNSARTSRRWRCTSWSSTNTPSSQQCVDALLSAARLHDKLKQKQAGGRRFTSDWSNEHPQYPKLDAVLYEWAWALLELKQAGRGRGFRAAAQGVSARAASGPMPRAGWPSGPWTPRTTTGGRV